MLKGKKAVIFDLDGTLIDSLGIWSAVDELLATNLGRPDLAADPVTLARLREDALVRHALEPNPYVGFCADLAAFCGSPLPGLRAAHAACIQTVVVRDPWSEADRARLLEEADAHVDSLCDAPEICGFTRS